MALSHKRLLKKKQKKQKKQRRKQSSVTPKAFYELPVLAAWETDFIQGIISVCFARRISASEYHLSMYLLDTWALGVKDAYMRRCSYEEYDKNIESSHKYKRAEPGRLKQLIIDTVTFGRRNGFVPAGDYPKMLLFLNHVSTEGAESHDVSFGDNGKVVYIANPEIETAKEIKERLATLTETLGSGKFHFVAPQEIISPETTKGYSKQALFHEGKPVDMDELAQEDVEKRILMTTTNESHMMVRLYYNIIDFNALTKALDKLDCVEYFDATTFHLNYEKEAINFGLDVAYNKVPEKLFPIILGYGHFFNNNTLLKVDVRSNKRAVSMIEFIDKHIERNVLLLDEMATYNEMMYNPKVTFDEVFKDIEENPQENFSDFQNEIENDRTLTKQQKSAKVLAYINQIGEKIKPLVTKSRTVYYEDGAEGLEFKFNIQEIVAHKHATGFPNYTIKDVINKTVKSKLPHIIEDSSVVDSVIIKEKTYSVGDVIQFSGDFSPEEYDISFSGFVGRIVEIDHEYGAPVTVEWDSITQNSLPDPYIKYCNSDESDLCFEEYDFTLEALSKFNIIVARDTCEDAWNTRDELYEKKS